MSDLRRSYMMSHLPFSYEVAGDFFVPFVLGQDDRTGDNIADRKQFSETRGHYWLWKNLRPENHNEFVSVQQYRRCFYFAPLIAPKSRFTKHTVDTAYNLGQQITYMDRAEYIAYLNYVAQTDRGQLDHWLEGVDIVVGRPIEYPTTIAQIYGQHHRAQDWEVFAGVCRKRGYDDGRHPWLTGHLMFMMRAWVFDEYMRAWWGVMEEVDSLLPGNDDPYQHRSIGYLSERFLSAWLIRTRVERPWLRIQTLPIVESLFQFDRQPGMM